MTQWNRAIAVAGIIGAVIAMGAYLWLVHDFTVRDVRDGWGYGVALVSMVVVVVAASWTSRWRWPVALVAVAVAALAWRDQAGRGWDPRWVYLAQHAGSNALLAWIFGRTLIAGRRPLITRLALTVHGELPPHLIAYTRSVTVAWTVFFVAMALVSLGLWLAGQAYWWSVLANLLTAPAVLLMFVAEYAVRRWRFPDFQHVDLMAGVRAFSRGRQ